MLEILAYCFENKIILCDLISHTSHELQPCDGRIFGPLKVAYRDQAERLYIGSLDIVNKQHLTSLYKPAGERALIKRKTIVGGLQVSCFCLIEKDSSEIQ
jgi:hypothetical protein